MLRHRIQIDGVVQGVGFRPFVHGLAERFGLSGWVRNQPDGVTVEVQGDASVLTAFLEALSQEKPAPARLRQVVVDTLEPLAEEQGFRIVASESSARTRPAIPPDLALCAACAREMDDPTDRRYRYPFTNCTHCGPRHSIIESLPYDRPRTAMKDFPLCPDCLREYQDVRNRRFHAQPVACPTCGPVLTWWSGASSSRASGEAALDSALQCLRQGGILALKGLGGYQLLVDATREDAVQRLRQRKAREAKPFAVMVPDSLWLETLCTVTPDERAWLEGPEAPIVLLPHRKPSPIAPSVAPDNPWLGVFLPYTPLHTLLLQGFEGPLVCTSGNLSDEPMVIEDAEVADRLGAVADGFLGHNRPIVRPVDDSVLRVDAHGPLLLRRARGFAPQALPVPYDGPPILALGAHQKATVCLLWEGQAVVSQHLGDLGSPESMALLQRTVTDLTGFFALQPGIVACDLHPDYGSTRLAEALADGWGVPLVRVQHHHAHGAALMAEAGLSGPVTALAWDGTGLGTDGTLWGGEALVLQDAACQRLGHLKPFPLPGGDAAARDPRRSLLGLVWGSLGEAAAAPLQSRFSDLEWRTLTTQLERQLHCPRSSSLGRLFDAVSALLEISTGRGFEGQAAMALEWAAAGSFHLGKIWDVNAGEADPAGLLQVLFEHHRHGRSRSDLAAGFHEALVDLALLWAQAGGHADVLLTGGCFQNRLLLAGVGGRLREAGFRVHIPMQLPPNDGAISLGQAFVAAQAWKRGLP